MSCCTWSAMSPDGSVLRRSVSLTNAGPTTSTSTSGQPSTSDAWPSPSPSASGALSAEAAETETIAGGCSASGSCGSETLIIESSVVDSVATQCGHSTISRSMRARRANDGCSCPRRTSARQVGQDWCPSLPIHVSMQTRQKECPHGITTGSLTTAKQTWHLRFSTSPTKSSGSKPSKDSASLESAIWRRTANRRVAEGRPSRRSHQHFSTTENNGTGIEG
mmetsp:Transcript_3365/g.10340  ORF Transcript_3365/g.10340 Transcript_3365/m.10340 type:complete len:221 (+) Transcript_3365:303-965(+)